PRIKHLEERLASLPLVTDLPETVDNLRATVDNLTRAWLRLQNQVSRLSTSVPEAAAASAQGRIAEFERQAAERGRAPDEHRAGGRRQCGAGEGVRVRSAGRGDRTAAQRGHRGTRPPR
ncbi:MAG: hypothetical protein ACRDK0_02175, partial [Solirubrobacteraceae bacterium]